mgnify:CR=1 FL=1
MPPLLHKVSHRVGSLSIEPGINIHLPVESLRQTADDIVGHGGGTITRADGNGLFRRRIIHAVQLDDDRVIRQTLEDARELVITRFPIIVPIRHLPRGGERGRVELIGHHLRNPAGV